MEKLNRNQLPDSSSSPLGSIFHTFDDEVINDFPSCVYGVPQNPHHHHSVSGISSSGNQLLNLIDNNIKINQNESKIRHHQYSHHVEDLGDIPPSFNSLPPSNYNTQARNARHNGPGKERKRTVRSAPNG
jgi:hypothetical protein